jgi:PAS domain S-box-containing protein
MFTDVTRRKHAEVRLATLLQGLPDTALYQTGGGIEYVSDGITNMLGFLPEVFQKDRNFFVGLIHPDDRLRIHQAQTQWIGKGSRGVLEMEFRARHCDGHYIWLLDRMSKAFTTPDGRQSSQGVMIDITARKQLEEERQVEVAEMEAVFQALPDLLFRIDKDGVILNYRAGRDDYLFVKPEKFLNKSMFDVLPHPVGDQCRFAVEQTLQNRQQVSIEYSLTVPAGKRLFEAKFFYITNNLITVVIRTKQ